MTGPTFDIWSALALLVLVLLVLRGIWMIAPRRKGVPRTPVRRKWIRQAMKLANVRPGEMVYDLGAGDGRALIIAAREFQARAVGIEIEPLHCVVAWFRALFSGAITRVTIRRRNLFYTDLSDADVILLYLNPDFVEKLRPQFELSLRPGTRVVSISFPFEGWQPTDIDIGHLIFLYQMPPKPGSIETYIRETTT